MSWGWWIVDGDLWIVDRGLGYVDYRLRIVVWWNVDCGYLVCGLWIVDCGL